MTAGCWQSWSKLTIVDNGTNGGRLRPLIFQSCLCHSTNNSNHLQDGDADRYLSHCLLSAHWFNAKQKTNKHWTNIVVWQAPKFEASKGPKFVEHKQNCEHNGTHTRIKAPAPIPITFTNFRSDYHFQRQLETLRTIHVCSSFFIFLA